MSPKTTIIFLLFIINSFFCFTQNNVSDSIKSKSYKELSTLFYKYNNDLSLDSEIGELYTDEFLKRAKKQNNIVHISDCYRYKSLFREHETSIKYCDSILYISKKAKNYDYIALGHMLKGYFISKQDADVEKETLDQFLEAYKYTLKDNNIVLQVQIKGAIANIKINNGDYQGALNEYKKLDQLIAFCLKIKNTFIQKTILINYSLMGILKHTI